MWSIGCIMGELIQKEPLLPGKGEIDQINRVGPDPAGLRYCVSPELRAFPSMNRRY